MRKYACSLAAGKIINGDPTLGKVDFARYVHAVFVYSVNDSVTIDEVRERALRDAELKWSNTQGWGWHSVDVIEIRR